MPSQMTFRPAETPLRDLLEAIHRGDLQLPDFQRNWVWDDERIRDLLGSVSQAWPVGAVLLLECGGEVRFKARPVEGAPENAGREQRLILDGQQRLTSLYLALRSGAPVPTTDERGSPIKRVYYFDIRKALDPSVERKDAILSLDPTLQIREDFNRKVKLDLSSPDKEYAALCVPVVTAFDASGCRSWRREMSRHHGHSREIDELYDRFDEQVVEAIQQYRVPSIELGRSTSRQAVCMVFEKVNTGGKPLDVFELVTATYAARDYDLRADWKTRAERIQAHRLLKGITQTDFLQAVTLYSTSRRGQDGRVHVGCRRVDMLSLPLDEYRAHVDAIEQGFIAAAKLLEREKVFDPEYLPYQVQLVAFAAIAAVLGPKVTESATREKILQWYWCGVFGELYSGATETRFGRDITEVPAWIDGGAEPTTVRDCNFAPSRLATLSTRNSAAYKGFMALLLKEGAQDLFHGDTFERDTYTDDQVDLCTVFPPAHCKGGKEGLSKSILNKTPMAARTHKKLGNVAPSVWVVRVERSGLSPARVDEELRSHCIEPGSLRRDDFGAFAVERARRLLDAIERVTGKPINGRESEEAERAFGAKVPRVRPEETAHVTVKLFDQYEVLETFPSAGMSEGYKVRAPDGTLLFLKKVPIEGVQSDALRREIDIYSKLERADVQSVLRIFGYERNDTYAALLTEFADGGTLAAWIKSQGGSLPPAQARPIAITVLDALRSLHAIDVVHRDLKPENVLRCGSQWKLGDFGIAKNLARLVTQHRTFAGYGTPGFAPPEQNDGAEAHPSADVYAFGKLLVYLLTGQTDVDKVIQPSWAKLAQACTVREPSQRPTLDEVEATLLGIHV